MKKGFWIENDTELRFSEISIMILRKNVLIEEVTFDEIVSFKLTDLKVNWMATLLLFFIHIIGTSSSSEFVGKQRRLTLKLKEGEFKVIELPGLRKKQFLKLKEKLEDLPSLARV